MKLCAYQNGEVRCKMWVQDEDKEFCPWHSGILKREDGPTSEIEQKQKALFDAHYTLCCDEMTIGQIETHLLQLDSLLEQFQRATKTKIQAASAAKAKKIKGLLAGGKLTDEEKAELESLRNGARVRKTAPAKESKPKISEEEKELQRYVKMGYSREKAQKMIDMFNAAE